MGEKFIERADDMSDKGLSFERNMLFVLSLPFFFQAEDGIRDLYVTGVQTCALPISGLPACLSRRAPTPPQFPAAGRASWPRHRCASSPGQSADTGSSVPSPCRGRTAGAPASACKRALP